MFEIPTDFAQIVRAAGERSEVRDAVDAVYVDLASAVDARKPRCDVSGRCCNFERYGHSLFITTMELATFVHGLSRENFPLPDSDGGGCRFQIGKLCGVHPIRPFGCRIFFCDPTSTDWQQSLYGQMHERLRALHRELLVPYHYVEWRKGLAALSLDRAAGVVNGRNQGLRTRRVNAFDTNADGVVN